MGRLPELNHVRFCGNVVLCWVACSVRAVLFFQLRRPRLPSLRGLLGGHSPRKSLSGTAGSMLFVGTVLLDIEFAFQPCGSRLLRHCAGCILNDFAKNSSRGHRRPGTPT